MEWEGGGNKFIVYIDPHLLINPNQMTGSTYFLFIHTLYTNTDKIFITITPFPTLI